MTRACRLLLPGLAFIPLACGGSPSVSYEVRIAEGCPGRLDISMTLTGMSRDSLTLQGYAPRDVLRIEHMEATGPAGEKLGIRPAGDRARGEEPPPDQPEFRLAGPLPEKVVVRYQVSPGKREGDSHVGFTGRVQGYLGREFGLVTGRELFLLPQPAEAIRDLSVKFSLPEPWTAVTPLASEGDRFRAGIQGKWAAEHLVSAAFGLGRFRERAFQVGGTRYRLDFEAGIPGSDQEKAASRMEVVAGDLRKLFGRDLGPEYVVVAVPRSPAGDEIRGEGWATGQGQTFVPLTGSRLRRFAEQLIEAYARHAPYRTEISRSEEYWLVDAITGWYGRRALSVSGLAAPDPFPPSLAVAYLNSLNVEGLERNLEKLYTGPGSHRAERQILAPAVLGYLDHELKSGGGSPAGFDPILARLFRERSAPSLWSLVPEIRPGFREDFRRRVVQGGGTIPMEKLLPLVPTSPDPDPPADPAVRSLTILYTGRTEGYLENCGCKVNQAGGVARRASEVERIRRSDPSALLLDAGAALLGPGRQRELDFLSREEQKLYLRTLDYMRYDAVALGVNELAFGVDSFRELTEGVRTPFLAASIRRAGSLLAPGSRILRAGDIKVAVMGVFEPPAAEDADSAAEDALDALQLADPVETLRREAPALKRQADLVVALGRLTPLTIRRIASTCPEVDMIISTEFDAPFKVEKPTPAWRAAYRSDVSGFLGRTLVATTSLTSYGLGSVRIGLDRRGRIARAAFDDLWLYQDVPDEPRVRRMMDEFYQSVGRLAAAQRSVPPLFASDPERMRGRYVGVSQCKRCHSHEYLQWMTTPHATAYKTLLDRHRHYQPRCVSCHVVGYGTDHGFKLGDAEGTLANVQCEVCHGPGGAHADAPAPANIRRRVPEGVCLECHNPDHSDHFVYSKRLPEISHGPAAASVAGGKPGAASHDGGGPRP